MRNTSLVTKYCCQIVYYFSDYRNIRNKWCLEKFKKVINIKKSEISSCIIIIIIIIMPDSHYFNYCYFFFSRDNLSMLSLIHPPSDVKQVKVCDSFTISMGKWLGIPAIPFAVSFYSYYNIEEHLSVKILLLDQHIIYANNTIFNTGRTVI